MTMKQAWIAAIAGLVVLALAFGGGYGLGLHRGLRFGHSVPVVKAVRSPTIPAVALAQDQWTNPPYPYSEVPNSLQSMARSLEAISRTMEADCRHDR